MLLKQIESDEISQYFEAGDIAYHKISIPEFEGQGVFYRIVNEDYDTISKGIAETKMSIRYFDVKESGAYTIILTNLAQEKMNYEKSYLLLEDVLVLREPREKDKNNQLSSDKFSISLSTELTNDLIEERMARELVSYIQNKRKKQGLKITDRTVSYNHLTLPTKAKV